MILHEIHKKGKSTWNDNWTSCQCSYCHGLGITHSDKLHYGLNIPKDWKATNSWWVIKYAPYRYIRWTNSWLLKFKKK